MLSMIRINTKFYVLKLIKLTLPKFQQVIYWHTNAPCKALSILKLFTLICLQQNLLLFMGENHYLVSILIRFSNHISIASIYLLPVDRFVGSLRSLKQVVIDALFFCIEMGKYPCVITIGTHFFQTRWCLAFPFKFILENALSQRPVRCLEAKRSGQSNLALALIHRQSFLDVLDINYSLWKFKIMQVLGVSV